MSISKDKAIPSRPFLPGSTSLRDRLGADLTLVDNTVRINTLGDNSSILITTSSFVPLPSNNFTSLGVGTSPNNFTVVNQTGSVTSSLPTVQVTSSLPTVEDPFALAAQQLGQVEYIPFTPPPEIVNEYGSLTEKGTSTSSTLPFVAYDDEFISLYEDVDLKPGQTQFTPEVSQNTGYQGLPVDIQLTLIEGRAAASGNRSAAALDWNKLNATQKANAQKIINVGRLYGLSDVEIKAILAVSSKEGGFMAKVEDSYRNTDAQYMRDKVFITAFNVKNNPATGKKWTNAEIDVLKKNDEKFFNYVYGAEQYKYRGRAFNGITFKAVYQDVQRFYEQNGKKLDVNGRKVNIVTNPQSLENDYELMAHATVLYFKGYKQQAFNRFPSKDKTKLEDLVYLFIRLNAGLGVDFNNATVQKGYQQALAFSKTLPTTLP